MSKVIERLGANIRLFRQMKGMTQERLSELVDVSSSYIGYLERGKKKPSLDLLEKISDVLEVEPSTLIGSSERPVNIELKKLITLLSDKEPEHIKFLHEVGIAYFKSIDKLNKDA